MNRLVFLLPVAILFKTTKHPVTVINEGSDY